MFNKAFATENMKKAVATIIVLVLIVIISIASVIVIQHTSSSNNWYNYPKNVESQQLESEALTFIKNIIQLDYTKYYEHSGAPPAGGPQGIEYYLNYENSSNLSTLEKNQQELFVSYVNSNYTGISFNISTGDGLISYRDDANSVIDQTKDILERYQTTYNATYIQDLLNSLDSYKTVANSSQQIGDIHLEMSSTNSTQSIAWSRAINGIPNSYDTLSIVFNDGIFNTFDDSWNLFKIGSANVNISQEKALQIADQNVQNQKNPLGSVELVDNSVSYTLSFQPTAQFTWGETPTLIYPCWQLCGNVNLVEDSVIAHTGNVYLVIRADTGQVQNLNMTFPGITI